MRYYRMSWDPEVPSGTAQLPSGVDRREAIKQAQAIVRKHVKKGRSLVDELKRERQAEAERE